MAGVHLQDLILDVKATASNEQKIDCVSNALFTHPLIIERVSCIFILPRF